MEERGLIEPEPVGDDERRRPYRITGAGQVALEGAVRDMRALADEGADAARDPRQRARDRRAGVTADPYERLLRWYPPQWRDRYGDEMTALLEDRYAAAADVPWRDRWGLVRAGVAERARAAGLIGSGGDAPERLRSGSVLVLCGWGLFLVALAIFGKATDNWLAGTPRSGRWVAVSGFDALAVAAVLGCALVLAAALWALPAFGRLLRDGGWGSVRGPVSRAVASAAAALALFGGAVGWAHHLSRHDRNGGLLAYSVLFVVLGLAAVVALGCATTAATAVARRIDLPTRTLRALGSWRRVSAA